MRERKNDGNHSVGEDKMGPMGPHLLFSLFFHKTFIPNDLFKGSLNLPLFCIEEVY